MKIFSMTKVKLPITALNSEHIIEKYFFYFSNETYVVGAQKNWLNETVLLRTQNKCSNLWIRKYSQLHAQKFFIS